MFSRTVTLEADFDLNNVCGGDGMLFVRDGVGHAARGIAATADSDTVRRVLADIDSDGGSPVAFGLVPFLPSAASRFFIPAETFTKHPCGTRTLTLVSSHRGGTDDEHVATAVARATASVPPRPSSNSFNVAPVTPVGRYLDSVRAARDAVRSGRLDKAVIARDISVEASEPIDVHAVLLRLRASFGSSYRYLVDNMLGASPELLVEVDGRTVRSHPLAGTAPRTGDPQTDQRLAAELIASTKNQVEHRLVIDMVRDTLLPHCSYLDWEAEPSIVTVANVQHLGTACEGALNDPPTHILDLVRALCPTPALGGHPSADAIEFVVAHESMERGDYGGAVGWLNADGNGIFAVTIRCAELSDDRRSARLFAGGGIVAESDPWAELAETQAKFQAMLSAIVRP